MILKTYKCPNCGAIISIDSSAKNIRCDYCDSPIAIERETKTVPNAGETSYEYERQDRYYDSGNQRPDVTIRVEVGDKAYINGRPIKIVSQKSRLGALLLCFFLGVFGAHHFYVGRIGMGVAYLLTAGFCGIGWLVDLILICVGSFHDKEGRMLEIW